MVSVTAKNTIVKNKAKKKKKVKKSKKSKKKSKKKVKKTKKVEQQPKLEAGEEIEEILDWDFPDEEEKKDLPVVELKVNSASKIWTNEFNVSRFNVEKAFYELLIGEGGCIGAPKEVEALYKKNCVSEDDELLVRDNERTFSNYLVSYFMKGSGFGYLSKDCLTYFYSCVDSDSELEDKGYNNFMESLKIAGLDLDLNEKQFRELLDDKITVKFTAGNVVWHSFPTGGCCIKFERLKTEDVHIKKTDLFKACTKHKLVFTNDFYSKFSKILDIDWISLGSKFKSDLKYNKETFFCFSKGRYDEPGIEFVSFLDRSDSRETSVLISGSLNADTRVSELAKILDEYTGIDLYTFDISRINDMPTGDVDQEFKVKFERDLGDSHVSIHVTHSDASLSHFSISLTRSY